MKKLAIITLLFLFCFTRGKSQTTTVEHINKKGESSLNLDMGLLSVYTFDEEYNWKSYGVGASYIYAVSNTVNIGFETYLNVLSSQSFKGLHYSYSLEEWNSFTYRYDVNAFTFFAKSQFYWLNRPHIGLYSGLDIGYISGSVITKIESGYGNPEQYEVSHAGGQLTAVGVKLALSEHWLMNGELGIGSRGLINLSIGYKL